MPDFSLSVLFIPFDATQGHVRRNAGLGVTGYPVEQAASPFTPAPLARHLSQTAVAEAPGSVMALQTSRIAEIVSRMCALVLEDTRMTPGADGAALARLQATAMRDRLLPTIVFLSEEPTAAPFPPEFDVTLGSDTYTYFQIGEAGSKAVQTIKAYVRSKTAPWSCQALTKQMSPSDPPEHFLAVTYDGKFCVAGVHLSSKNVGVSSAKALHAFADLKAFCGSVRIGGVIGDLNLDAAATLGEVGARPGTTVFLLQDVPAPAGRVHQEQFSSSNNKNHFMGALSTASHVRASNALSLERSLSGEFFSDHPPIFSHFTWFW